MRDLFDANYTNYKNNYRADFQAACDQTKDPDPASPDESATLAHVYGWMPFNANCSAETNLLENTPGYEENNNCWKSKCQCTRIRAAREEHDAARKRFTATTAAISEALEDVVRNLSLNRMWRLVFPGGPSEWFGGKEPCSA